MTEHSETSAGRYERTRKAEADFVPREYLHLIGIGYPEDWQAGRGSLYYIENGRGETVLPVFTTAEKASKYVQANFNTTKAHMEMLESTPIPHAAPLTGGRFSIMPLDVEGLAIAAATVGADCLVRDPRPGARQEVLRVTPGERGDR